VFAGPGESKFNAIPGSDLGAIQHKGKAVTAQIAEKLIYSGERHAMLTNPLDSYFAMGGIGPNFEYNCTALWRGYVGTWEIVSDRLYLIGLHGTLEGGEVAVLATIFPDYPARVFAHWFSGTVRIPQGKKLEYVHMGDGTTYERDLLLEFEQGVLIDSRIRVNGASSQVDAPEGYSIGAMTVFERAPKDERGGQ
jgi:hypothetical protein